MVWFIAQLIAATWTYPVSDWPHTGHAHSRTLAQPTATQFLSTSQTVTSVSRPSNDVGNLYSSPPMLAHSARLRFVTKYALYKFTLLPICITVFCLRMIVWVCVLCVIQPTGCQSPINLCYNTVIIAVVSCLLSLIAHDAFVITNRRAIAMIFVRSSVWDGRASWSHGAL